MQSLIVADLDLVKVEGLVKLGKDAASVEDTHAGDAPANLVSGIVFGIA